MTAVDLSSRERVEVPCGDCGIPVPTVAFFAAPARRKHVKCQEHAPSTSLAPVTWQDLWNQRVPARFRGVGLDGIPDEALRALFAKVATLKSDTLTGTAKGFLLTGPTGVRKTGACYALLNALVAAGTVAPNDIVTVSEADWLPPMATVSRFGSDKQIRQQMRADLSGKKVLLLDDLGYGRYPSKEDQMALLLAVLERVENNDILLLVTTNLTLPGLAQWVGPAAWSRLWERVGQSSWTAGHVDTRTGQDHRGP